MNTECAPANDAGGAPPQGGPPLRRSRASKWRAAVLIAVHVAIALHLAHWWVSGATLSPLEPSEAMEFSKRGIVSAGAIFFALAILSTAVLGRWFCGWACHMVALQDLALWLLGKLHVRPRPIQLGLLGSVPWIVFVYMFLGPVVYRALHRIGFEDPALHLTTTSFWATFPGPLMTVTTFVVCGFAIIYFIGAKGFCTYGCPYGAIFGIGDQFAPLRIRVTDACSGCGHCTQVCTSNVDVQREVRDFKAVIDPGCMKCLDCVSVCPKDALYLGWGAPALATRRVHPSGQLARRWAPRVARVALTAAFLWGTFVLLLTRGGDFEAPLALSATLAAGALLVALVFAGKAERPGQPTLGEDAWTGLVFLASLYVFRGLAPFPFSEEQVPLLLALGLAALSAYVGLVAARLAWRADVAFQRFELKHAGRVTRAGWVFVACWVPLSGAWLSGGWSQQREDQIVARRRADEAAARVQFERALAAAQTGRVAEALAGFETVLALAPDYPEVRESMGGTLCAAGRFEEGIAVLAEAVRRRPDGVDALVLLGRAYAESGDELRAEESWTRALRLEPDNAPAHLGLAVLCQRRGDTAGAHLHREQAGQAPSAESKP